jgi:amidase
MAACPRPPSPQAAVAAGQADLGLGTDTGGSVRVPASYCGLWGIRTTHGRVPMAGARALASSFSTAGLLSRDARLLRAAGSALLAGAGASAARPLPGAGGAPGAPRLLVAADAFELALPEPRAALRAALAAPVAAGVLGAPAAEVVLGEAVAVGGGKTGLDAWFDVFRVIQVGEWMGGGWREGQVHMGPLWRGSRARPRRRALARVLGLNAAAPPAPRPQAFDAWAGYGGWITSAAPAFGPGVRERFQAAASVTAQQRGAAAADRAAVRAYLIGLLGADGVLALPSAPGPAPERGLPGGALDDWRRRVMSLTCVAGLGALPQVGPWRRLGGRPRRGASSACLRRARPSSRPRATLPAPRRAPPR